MANSVKSQAATAIRSLISKKTSANSTVAFLSQTHYRMAISPKPGLDLTLVIDFYSALAQRPLPLTGLAQRPLSLTEVSTTEFSADS